MVNCSMELGGNAPFIVFEDADIDAAVEGALIAKMRNGGEACTAANRFYVHEAVADEFSRGLRRAAGRAWSSGPAWTRRPTSGPLVNEPTRTKVAGLVESAAADGGTVRHRRRGRRTGAATSTRRPCSTRCRRTRASSARRSSARSRPSSGSPPKQTRSRWANDTEFGLVAYVYTRDLGRGLRVSEALETGMVGLNRGLVSDPAAPFGGVKQSGIGREGAHEGLLEFTETKYIATSW